MANYQLLKNKTLKETRKAKDTLKDTKNKQKGALKELIKSKGQAPDDEKIYEVDSNEEDSNWSHRSS